MPLLFSCVGDDEKKKASPFDVETHIRNHPDYDPNAPNYGPPVPGQEDIYDMKIPNPDNYTQEKIDSAINSAPNAQEIFEGIGMEFIDGKWVEK
tara:strand:+ start:403 stop:684 length:282 start_codon:yes stop_codon:yes gene_type:complete